MTVSFPMILFLKSTSDDDGRHKLSLREKLVLVFKEKVETADNDKNRARAKRDLAKIRGGSENSDKESAVC